MITISYLLLPTTATNIFCYKAQSYEGYMKQNCALSLFICHFWYTGKSHIWNCWVHSKIQFIKTLSECSQQLKPYMIFSVVNLDLFERNSKVILVYEQLTTACGLPKGSIYLSNMCLIFYGINLVHTKCLGNYLFKLNTNYFSCVISSHPIIKLIMQYFSLTPSYVFYFLILHLKYIIL